MFTISFATDQNRFIKITTERPRSRVIGESIVFLFRWEILNSRAMDRPRWALVGTSAGATLMKYADNERMNLFSQKEDENEGSVACWG